MKKLLLTLLFLTAAPGLARADAYQYQPKQPHVEVDWALLGTDDGTAAARPPAQRIILTPPSSVAAAAASTGTPQAPVQIAPLAAPAPTPTPIPAPAVAAAVPPAPTAEQPAPKKRLLEPLFTAPAKAESTAREALPPEAANTSSNEEFLDKIMAYHLPPGMKTAPLPAPPLLPAALPQKTEVPATPKKAEEPVNITEPDEVTIEKAPEKKVEAKPAKVAPALPEPTEVKPVEATPAPEKKVAAEQEEAKPAEAKPAEVAPAVPKLSQLTLPFDKTATDVSPAAQKNLDALIVQLKDMPDMRIQIRAYATGEEGSPSTARRISLARALAVRAYLTDKGIKPVRLDVRALGTEAEGTPVDQVELVFVR